MAPFTLLRGFSAKVLDLETLEQGASGRAKLVLAGQAAEFRPKLARGVDLDARDPLCRPVTLDASSGRTVRVEGQCPDWDDD
jgi:hypothetical protein